MLSSKDTGLLLSGLCFFEQGFTLKLDRQGARFYIGYAKN